MRLKKNTPATSANASRRDHRSPMPLKRAQSRLADSTIIQALIAGALSFTHIRDIALRHNQAGWKSWAYPLSVDLLTVAAYRRLKRDRAADESAALAWCWFIVSLLASLGANVADSVAAAPPTANRADIALNVIIGMWPAAAFLGSTLLGHTDRPTDHRPTVDRAPTADQPAPSITDCRPVDRPTERPAATAQPNRPATDPAPIPVRPTGRLGDLGPRAASTGELPMTVWITIGHPLYLDIQRTTGRRPTEAALQQALGERTATLIASGDLPPAVGRPSTSTAKRVRKAIESVHPTLTPRLAAVPA